MAPEPEPEIGRPADANGLMLPHLFRVESRRRETPDTFTLALSPTGPEPGWPFAPGQFNMLTVFVGIGEVPISISGDPAEPRRLIHTIRAVGVVTRALCGSAPGDTIGVRGPFGTAWPVAEAQGRELIIVAGGLGLAPVRPAIYQALANRAAYGSVELIYGARTPADILYYLGNWNAGGAGSRAGARHRGHGPGGVAGESRGGHQGHVPGAFRPGPHHGPGVRPRIDDALHGPGAVCPGVSPDQVYVSMERNMQCGMGLCGHCQLGPLFICKDGPVFPYSRVKDWFEKREV